MSLVKSFCLTFPLKFKFALLNKQLEVDIAIYVLCATWIAFDEFNEGMMNENLKINNNEFYLSAIHNIQIKYFLH